MGIIINGLTDTVTAADGSLNIGGDVTIPGELSYDDVTNIDSVGVITARAGINISGGNLQVDSTNVINSGRVLYNLEQIKLADAKELVLGSSNDLKIYHSGSHSFISEEGAGALKIKGDDIRFENASATEALRIDSAGNLGIGDASPTKPLTVGTTTPVILLDDQSSRTLEIRGPSTTHSATVLTTSTHDLLLGTNNAERLRITSAGNVGINDQSPDNKLHITTTSSSAYSTNTTNTSNLTNALLKLQNLDGSDGTGANNYVGIQFSVANGATSTAQIQYVRTGDNAGKFEFKARNTASNYPNIMTLLSSGRVGINETSPTALLDINHPHTEQGLKVRSRYGNIATAMVKFDTDPQSDGGDGNVLHLHGGSSRTDSEILHIDSTGVGDIFDIRGDGLTRVYKQLQLEHSSNVAKIIFNEYGANDIKAQIEMDQLSGSSGQLIFRTQNSGTLSERMRITNDGHVLKSDTPAFQCKLATATGNNFNGILVFNSVRYNIGNHYSSSNGRFTAPVDGRYLFAWYTNMERSGGNGSLWADWYVNGSGQGNRMYTHHSGAWELIGGTIIMDLNANDYVQVYTGQPGNWDGGSYGAFSGYLLG